ncbi:MAG: hypothetical protein C0501_08545 [Isosphaera sp.]|nr:hypothetical protein [Isosphaera sp.]
MTVDEFNANEFIRNQNAYPTGELLRYAGKHVAWSGDGTTILLAADTGEELIDLSDSRLPPDEFFVLSYVPADWDGKHDRPFRPAPIPAGSGSNGAAP